MKKIALTFCVVLAGCSSSESTTTSYDHSADLIKSWTQLYSDSWINESKQFAVDLDEKITVYCEDTDLNTIDDSQDAWIALNTSWQKVRVLNSKAFSDTPQTLGSFSLATRMHTGHEFETQNGAASVNAYILDQSSPAVLFDGNANLQGIPALEYILFEESVDTALACSAAMNIAENVIFTLDTLKTTWQEQLGDLLAPAEVVGGFTSNIDVVEDFLNGLYAYLREINRYKLEIPLGISSGSLAPQKVESVYSQQSLETLKANYAGFRYLFLEGDYNLKNLMIIVGRTDLATQLEAILDSVDAELSSIQSEIQDLVISVQDDSDYQAYVRIHDATNDLVVLFQEGVIPAAGAIENFNKNDGD